MFSGRGAAATATMLATSESSRVRSSQVGTCRSRAVSRSVRYGCSMSSAVAVAFTASGSGPPVTWRTNALTHTATGGRKIRVMSRCIGSRVARNPPSARRNTLLPVPL